MVSNLDRIVVGALHIQYLQQLQAAGAQISETSVTQHTEMTTDSNAYVTKLVLMFAWLHKWHSSKIECSTYFVCYCLFAS